MWKMRAIFDKLSNSYVIYYIPTEKLAVDEIIVLFKGRVNFKQYIPKETQAVWDKALQAV